MSKDIKTKVTKKDIRKIDKVAVGTAKIKNYALKSKTEITSSDRDENTSTSNYAVNNVERIAQFSAYELNKYGKNAVLETKQNLIKTKEKIKNIKTKQDRKDIKQIEDMGEKVKNQKLKEQQYSKLKSAISEKKKIKSIENTNAEGIKDIKYQTPVNIKNIQNTGKEVIKTSNTVLQETRITGSTIKTNVQKASKILKLKPKKNIEIAKKSRQSVTAILKAIAKSSKAMWLGLIAGGWILVVVIIIICMIGLICNSSFGIFFANENTGGTLTLKQVMRDINKDFSQKLVTIQNTVPHDDYDIVSNRANWKDVIAIYAIKIGGVEDGKEVVTMTQKKLIF